MIIMSKNRKTGFNIHRRFGEHVHCPVCGNIVETYDICGLHHWQNTLEDVILMESPNKMTLAEAKESIRKKAYR